MRLLLLVSVWLGVSGPAAGAPSAGPQQQLQDLHCPACERIHCSTRRALKLQCRGGVTTGVCGCCPVCARTEGESCGGAWDYLGKCDEGLVCVQGEEVGDEERAETERTETTERTEKRGTCRTVIDPQVPEPCRPDCTKEYCQQNPTEICSARSVSLEQKSCQGSCQHTSCSSCLQVRPPPCPQTCSPSDHPCLQRFGKCVHRHLTAAHGPVCHGDLQNNPEGHFLCLVPSCPTTAK